MRRIAFRKMHGLGNDFVVLDARRDGLAVGAGAARALADRRTGIGCDQVILIEPAPAPIAPGPITDHDTADAVIRFFNPDGSEAGACGNGTRCVAWLIAQENGVGGVRLRTQAGLLDTALLADGRVAVDMGAPRTDWRDIPLAEPMDTLRADIAAGPLAFPVCTSIGNPHATFFVDDAESIDLAALGPVLEHDPAFPERANIGVAAVCSARRPGAPEGDRIRLRVWERGAGITRACGSGACAALVAAHRRGLAGRRATVALDGGELDILWREDAGGEPGHVTMTGPVALVFEGSFDPARFGL
ncbi:MAG: diaminopimelate epimerase [Alphaproteobacteria bacterium]